MNIYLMWFIIGLMIALYRIWSKMTNVDPLSAIFITSIMMTITSGVYLLLVKHSVQLPNTPNDILATLLMWCTLVISWYLITYVFQKWLKISNFVALYTIIWLVLVVLYGFMTGEKITTKAIMGLILSMFAIILLNG